MLVFQRYLIDAADTGNVSSVNVEIRVAVLQDAIPLPMQ